MTNLVETIKTDPQDAFLFFIVKTFAGIITAIIVLGISSFLLTILWIFIDFFIHPGVSTLSALFEKVRISFGVGFFISAYAVLIAIFCAMLFGFPLIFIGWRLKLIRWWTCVAGGVFLSCIPAGLFLWNATSINLIFTTILFSGLLGVATGLSFWFVWRFFTYSLAATKMLHKQFSLINLRRKW